MNAVDADEIPALDQSAGIVSFVSTESERAVSEISAIEGIPAKLIIRAVVPGDEALPSILPVATPGRIVLVTVEAYPSHIVTRPAIVVSGAPGWSSQINVQVFWDHFRDGSNLSPWRSNLPYCAEEKPGSWRFPSRS